MRGTLLSGLHSEVELHHAAWLADDILAKHLTLNLDGWSNARMESIYSFNVIFPDRRTILLKSEDLSATTHSAHNLAGACVFLLLTQIWMKYAEFECDVLSPDSALLCRTGHCNNEAVWAQTVCNAGD